MNVEIVKPELVPVENGTEDESKVNVPTEDHLPKNVVDEKDDLKPKLHIVYFVRHQRYDDLKPKFDAAEKDVQNKMQARAQIIEKLRALKLSAQIGPLSMENDRFKSLLDEKKKEMEPVIEHLNELPPNREKEAMPICSSEEDLNRTIKSLQYRIQQESIPLTEEKQILREIKQLEGTRGQVVAKAVRRADIEANVGTKTVLQDQYNLMGADFSDVKKERQAVTAGLQQPFDEKSALNKDIEKLEKELDDATDKCDKANDVVKDLWKKYDEGNACFYQYRKILNNAKNLTIKKNLAALKDFSNSELEKFMKMWNESKSFREDYEKRIIPSLDIRQLSRDGQIRGPGEKPLVVRK